jgi:Na+/proline symporter
MHPIDWTVLLAFLTYIVWDGYRRGRNATDAEGYFLAGRSVRWWAMGLSIMATQASAITLLSTTGHGYEEGMHFLHVYLALPFAVVILCSTVVPWFLKARVFTAYEFLESRFNGSTRTLAAAAYLISRGLVLGPILYAPSVVLSMMLGLDQWLAILIMGVLAIGYTVVGGIAAVIFTDVKQMIVMMLGIVVCLYLAITSLPSGVGFMDALSLAGIGGKLEAVVVHTNVEQIFAEKYNLLSALFGGLFLFLGYFGADQSQVQRLLTGQSVSQSRKALLLLAFAKVPMQFVILLLGALLFVHYTFEKPPVFFQETELRQTVETGSAGNLEQDYGELEGRFQQAWSERRQTAESLVAARREGQPLDQLAVSYAEQSQQITSLQKEGVALLADAVGEKRTDTNHIFPYFLLTELPIGLLGLVIAAVFAAAMSSVDSALSSLATSSVMDVYVRVRRRKFSEAHLKRAGQVATLFWGVFAVLAAFMIGNLGPMIEVVNRIGSMVYGPLFGIFFLGWLMPFVRGRVGCLSLVGGFLCVLFTDWVINAEVRRVEFLWYNLIGFAGVLLSGALLTVLSLPLRRGTTQDS